MLKQGVVIGVTRNTCQVDSEEYEVPFVCALRKKLTEQKRTRLVKHPIAVGDRVLFSLSKNSQENQGVIEEILERKNKFSRPSVRESNKEQVVVANLDQLLIVVAPQDGEISYGTIDRFLCSAENAQIEALICLNKMDLDSNGTFQLQMQHYSEMGYPVFFTSATTQTGLSELKKRLLQKNTALCGPSGVGKSSLLSAIQPSLQLRVKEVNPKTQAGRHTTSMVSLLKLDIGGYVVDTPGIREIGLWKLDSSELSSLFIDFEPYAQECRFRSCLHLTEPDCGIQLALTSKKIYPERYASYQRILRSLLEEEKENPHTHSKERSGL